MFIFLSKAERELESIVNELKQYLCNNYKDAAHKCRIELGEKTEAYFSQGKLSEKRYLHYRKIFNDYTVKMQNYHH